MQLVGRFLHACGLWCCLLIVPGCSGGEASKAASYNIKAAMGVKDLVPVVVIGSGPAGLSAALYTCRANIKTIVIEGEEPGGQLMKTSYVENWPGIKRTLGSSAVAIVREQAILFGVEFLTDAVRTVDASTWPFVISLESGKQIRALSIIVATGANPRYLGVPGEQPYWGHGVSACAICDAPFFKDEEVVIVGGGDAAAEEATQLAAYAKKVTVLVRKGQLRAASIMQDHLKGYSNIEIMFNVEVLEILGDGTVVTGVRLKNNKTGQLSDYPTSGVFLAIGRIPSSNCVKGVVALDAEGHILLQGRSQATSIPGIFAAGDVSDPVYRQAGVASGDGIKAGLDAERFLTTIGLNNVVTQQLEPNFVGGHAQEEEHVLHELHSVDELEKLLASTKTPVVLDFFTAHCPSCLQLMPKLARGAHDFEGAVTVYKIDAENASDIAQKYSVLRVPCLIVIQSGTEVARYTNDEEMKDLFTIEGVQQFLRQISRSKAQ